MQNQGCCRISGVMVQTRNGPPAGIAVEASISVARPMVEQLAHGMLFGALLDQATVGPGGPPWDLDGVALS